MGWFAKIEKKELSDMEKSGEPDKNNPFSMGIEDEGEFVTIVHARNIVPLEDEEDEEVEGKTEKTKTQKEDKEIVNGSSSNRQHIPQ